MTFRPARLLGLAALVVQLQATCRLLALAATSPRWDWEGRRADSARSPPQQKLLTADLGTGSEAVKQQRGRGRDEVKYHLYDPDQFLIYTRCNSTRPLAGQAKHSLDLLFIKKLIEDGRSVPPEEADIFVVPALLSQSCSKNCGDHVQNVDHLREKLESSPWYQRHKGADHLIMADDHAARRSLRHLPPGRFTFTHFECPDPEIDAIRNQKPEFQTPFVNAELKQRCECLPIGYSTFLAMDMMGATRHNLHTNRAMRRAATVPQQRRYDVAFIMKAPGPRSYRSRMNFVCSWGAMSMKGGPKDRFFVHLKYQRPRMPLCGARRWRDNKTWTTTHSNHRVISVSNMGVAESYRALSDSRFFLQLHGDTITTDRVFNMFDTLTIPITLESELLYLLRQMPFRDVVPWEDMFVRIPDTEWNRNPAQSVLDAIDALTPAEVEAKYRLLQHHAPDVSYAPSDTRAHKNLLATAFERMQNRRGVYVPP